MFVSALCRICHHPLDGSRSSSCRDIDVAVFPEASVPNHACYKEGPRRLRLFSLDYRRLRRDLVNVENYLKRGCKEGGLRVFPVVFGDKMETQEVPSEHL